jgi:hypothetical protein
MNRACVLIFACASARRRTMTPDDYYPLLDVGRVRSGATVRARASEVYWIYDIVIRTCSKIKEKGARHKWGVSWETIEDWKSKPNDWLPFPKSIQALLRSPSGRQLNVQDRRRLSLALFRRVMNAASNAVPDYYEAFEHLKGFLENLPENSFEKFAVESQG